MKFNMPEFDGVHDPKVFLDWIEAIERIFDYKRYDERKRYKFAVHTLTEDASNWYEELKARRRREGKQKIQSWEKLKKHLKRKFLPRNYEEKLYFQRIKSQIVCRKQEEPKRLILDPRNPPKSTTIQEDDPYISILEANRKSEERIKKMMEDLATMIARQQQEELASPMEDECSLPTSRISISPSMEEVTSQRMQVQAATVLQSEEEHKQVTAMANKEEQNEARSSHPSMAEYMDQETHHQSAPYTLDEPQRQQAQLNLRANSFQEREIDAGARGPKKKPNKKQPMYTLRPSGDSPRCEIEHNVKNTYEPNSKLNELWYQNPP